MAYHVQTTPYHTKRHRTPEGRLSLRRHGVVRWQYAIFDSAGGTPMWAMESRVAGMMYIGRANFKTWEDALEAGLREIDEHCEQERQELEEWRFIQDNMRTSEPRGCN